MRRVSEILFAVLLGAVAASTSEGAFLYRGRLTQGSGGETRFDDGAEYRMGFRFYRQPQGGDAFYSETHTVSVGNDGSFETLIDNPGLDKAFTGDDQTAYVGLTLDDGRELMPRRQILMLPSVANVRQANALADDPKIGTLTAGGVTAESVSISDLTGGCLSAYNALGAFPMQRLEGEDAMNLDLTSHRISLFGEVKELVSGKTPSKAGAALGTAPADGVAFIYASKNTVNPKCCGTVQFCRAGNEIAAPTAGEPLSVRFYSFVTK